MYERMLDRQNKPNENIMLEYSNDVKKELQFVINMLRETYQLDYKITFPYGNKYGWCFSYHQKNKLLFNIFPEVNAFTLMIHLSNIDCDNLEIVSDYALNLIDNKYPCGDGGWIHYQFIFRE